MKAILSFLYRKENLTLFLAILWMLVILLACFIPGNSLPDVDIFQADKLVHIALFGGYAFLWGILWTKHSSRKFVLLWVFLSGVALGALVEIIQSTDWVEGRGGDIWDVVADAVGSAAGVLLVAYTRHLRE